MSDPTKEKSVQGCGLSRRNRRITQEQRDQQRNNVTFPRSQTTGMPDGDPGTDNTPASRLRSKDILKNVPMQPVGFPGAGSMADAVATAPKPQGPGFFPQETE